MRKFFFLPSSAFYCLMFALVYILLNSSLIYKVLMVLSSFIIGYLMRRSVVPYRDTLKNDGEIYLSPVHGIVQNIRQTSDGHEVRISIGGWDEKGLYLPTAGEVSFLKAHPGKRISRDASPEAFYSSVEELSHTDLVLTSKNQTKSLMRFIDCKFGKRPTIWLKSGDRGRGAACFGFYPLGGTLIIYLPKNSDILVFEKEKIVPGQTVIAALREIK